MLFVPPRWRKTSSRIKVSEADNESESNLGIKRAQTGETGAVRKSLRRRSGTVPAPAAEVFKARIVEREDKGGRDSTSNCVCSVCAGWSSENPT